MEQIFETVESMQKENSYIIRFGAVEVRRNLIRDLLSSGVKEITNFGKKGPLVIIKLEDLDKDKYIYYVYYYSVGIKTSGI